MSAIVIIGASYLQKPLVEKVNELGYESHVFAWDEGAVCKNIAYKFYPISITEKDEILRMCKEKIHPISVLTIASDLAAITANYVSRKLGLCSNPEQTEYVATNKYAMRNRLSSKGIPCPKFKLINCNTSTESVFEEFRLPVVVKATDRSGSRGISLVESWNELDSAIKFSQEESFENKAILEQYVEGEEYSCECISFNGKHTFLSFTKKFVTDPPYFVELGHLQPALFSAVNHQKYLNIIFRALDALHIKNGASHTEFKIDKDGNMYIIEIGARMGGDFIGSDMVRLSTGYDFVKMVIDVSLGQEPKLSKVRVPKNVLVRFDMENIDDIPNDLIYNKVIMSDHKENIIHDSSQRSTAVILISDSIEEMEVYFPRKG